MTHPRQEKLTPEEQDADYGLPSVVTLVGVGAKISPAQFLRLNPHLPTDLTSAQLHKLNPKLLKSGENPAYDDDADNGDANSAPYDENDTTGLELQLENGHNDNNEGK
jgi:hypothetical protein